MSEEKLTASFVFGDLGNGRIELAPDNQAYEVIIIDPNGGQWVLTYSHPDTASFLPAKFGEVEVNLPLVPDPGENIDEVFQQLRSLFLDLYGSRSKGGRSKEAREEFLQKLALAMREADTDDTEFIAQHYPVAGLDDPKRGTDEATLYAAARRYNMKLSQAKEAARELYLRETPEGSFSQ